MPPTFIMNKKRFFVKVTYNDFSKFSFAVEVVDDSDNCVGLAMMIARGTLHASNAAYASFYRENGAHIISYKNQ